MKNYIVAIVGIEPPIDVFGYQSLDVLLFAWPQTIFFCGSVPITKSHAHHLLQIHEPVTCKLAECVLTITPIFYVEIEGFPADY